MKKTKIEWTEITWNPVAGCTKISAGCKNCYAETMAKRLQLMGVKQYENGFKLTLAPHMLNLPYTWKKGMTVFVNSMSDLFHEDVPLEYIKKVFKVMNETPRHTYQILTKRSGRLKKIANELNWTDNIWMGVSVEEEKVSFRIADLIETPAKTKFLSIEPLIAPVTSLMLESIDWVIVGGESGHNARQVKKEWVDYVHSECIKHKVPFFFKQWGKDKFNPDLNDPTKDHKHSLYAKGGCMLEGKVYREMPLRADIMFEGKKQTEDLAGIEDVKLLKGDNKIMVKEEACTNSPNSYDPSKSYDDEKSNDVILSDTFPSDIYAILPEFLKRGTNVFSTEREKDIFLIAALGVLSGCLPNIFGYYDSKKVGANLFIFIVAPASAGKSISTWAKYLGEGIHQRYKNINKESYEKYKADMASYKKTSKGKPNIGQPIAPPQLMFFIPANASYAAIINALKENKGSGVIFSSEADTLSAAIKQDWGGFSDMLRCAFHHEAVSKLRITEKEYIEIENPFLSVVLSGTPSQIWSLIPDAENGLFSRFGFYSFNLNAVWKNVFDDSKQIDLISLFTEMGNDLLQIYVFLQGIKHEIKFEYTKEQKESFNEIFAIWQDELNVLLGQESLATVRRLGVINFRIAMILTSLRMIKTNEVIEKLVCGDEDFAIALKISETLKKHAMLIFAKLPKQNKSGLSNQKLKFHEELPTDFIFKEAVEIGKRIGIASKTIEKYLKLFQKAGLIEKVGHGKYKKK